MANPIPSIYTFDSPCIQRIYQIDNRELIDEMHKDFNVLHWAIKRGHDNILQEDGVNIAASIDRNLKSILKMYKPYIAPELLILIKQSGFIDLYYTILQYNLHIPYNNKLR